jgi:hypothetical protein
MRSNLQWVAAGGIGWRKVQRVLVKQAGAHRLTEGILDLEDGLRWCGSGRALVSALRFAIGKVSMQ